MITFRQATFDDCTLIRDLALPSWTVAYGEILSEEQIAYMMEKMYSDESLRQQMQEGHVFFIAYDSGEPAGFVSLNPKIDGLYVLEKLYALPSKHGTGAGRLLVEKVEEYIRNHHPGQKILLELNVNRDNKAVGFYEHIGFRIDRTVDEYIGDGFYKNDYIMQKSVEG